MSALLGALLEIGGAALGNYASAKAATKAFDREKWLYSNRYQMQVADLKAAGLNPALAYGNPAPPAPSVQQAPQRGPDFKSVPQFQLVKSAAQVNSAQAAKAQAEAALAEAQAATERNRPENVQADTAYKKAAAALANAQSEVQRVTVDQIIQNTKTSAASASLMRSQEQVARATIPKLFAEATELTTRAGLQRMDSILAGLNAQEKQAVLPYLISMTRAESYAKQLDLPEREAAAKMWQTGFGQSALPWVREAANAVAKLPLAIGFKR